MMRGRKAGLAQVRQALEAIVEQAQGGALDEVIQTARQTLQSLDGAQLLTTREAADLLGLRSVNTLKALVVRLGVPYQRVGNRMMLAVSDVERLTDDPLLNGLRASEATHDALDHLGPD